MEKTSATHHSRKRIKERMKIGMKSADRQAELAIERGLHHPETTGRLHKWITSCWGRGGKEGRKYVVYNSNLFIFSADFTNLITVFEVPTNLLKLVDTQTKKAKKKLALEE